MQHRQ